MQDNFALTLCNIAQSRSHELPAMNHLQDLADTGFLHTVLLFTKNCDVGYSVYLEARTLVLWPSDRFFGVAKLTVHSTFYTLSIRCTTTAVAAPPPLHIAATPYSPTCNWCSNVVSIREPELPRACPSDMAPPRRFTFAFSSPRICF